MPLVFFHGWGFDHHVWQPLIEPLREHYQLILVDLPGFGLTSMMDWTCFKNRLLDQIPERFALVGWSLGGLYAQRLAIEAPHRVSSLMSITSSPRFTAEEHWPAAPQKNLDLFYQKLAVDADKTVREFTALQLGQCTITFPDIKTPSLQGLTDGLNILETWDLRDSLHELTMPVSYLFSRLDPIVPFALMNTMSHDYPQFDYLLFKKAAHMPFLSHRDLFIAELMRFIR